MPQRSTNNELDFDTLDDFFTESDDAAGSLDNICKGVFNREYVLVAGGDVIFKPTADNSNNHGVIDRMFRKWAEKHPEFRTDNDTRRRGNLVRYLRNACDYNIDRFVNPDLRALLETKCFPVVITTVYDSFLELVMHRIWGDNLQVINIFKPGDKNKFRESTEYEGYVRPTLVYAFGKAEEPNDKFVFNDDDEGMEAIARWLDSEHRPQDLIRYIQGKKMLGIGCKFDDWEFRFFWYSLHQKLENCFGDVAISLGESESDKKLANYLLNKFINNKGDARAFLRKLQQELNDPAKYTEEREAYLRRKGGVFISHAGEDDADARRFALMLADRGFTVWYDNRRLDWGADYDTRIATAIRTCSAFIPFLTGNTGKDLEARKGRGWEAFDREKERYYMYEWMLADRFGVKVLPVYTSGFDPRRFGRLLPSGINVSSLPWPEAGADTITDKLKLIL